MEKWTLSSACVLGAWAIAACGLSVAGSGPPTDDSGPDSGPDSTRSTAGEAGSDSGLVGDAASDARRDAGSDASPTHWCAGQPVHDVCIDLDDGVNPLTTITSSTGSSAMSTLFATSTPRSLRFATTSSSGEAYLIEDWRTPRSSVDVAFDVMVQGSGYAQIGGVTLGPSYYELLFQVTGGTISFNEWNSANGPTTHSLGATAAGWHRVTLHADLAVAGGKSTLRVGLDGVTRFQGMTAVSLPALGSVQAIVGLLYVDSAPKVVFVDNVTIDSKP